MQQDCHPFSQGWPACLNNKTQSQVHSILAQAIVSGALTVAQKEALETDPQLDSETQANVVSYEPSIGG